jgi:hypothetical protein
MAFETELSPAESLTGGYRRFVVAWQDPQTRRFESIGLLEVADREFRFHYLPRAREIVSLRPLPGFPDQTRTYTSPRLFVLFAQRLMNRRRPDYPAWLELLGLPQGAPDLDVLARSEGRRLGDNIALIPEPVVDGRGVSTATFFVHGLRHRMGDDPQVEPLLGRLRQGQLLRLAAEPGNPVNPLAVMVCESTVSLGWVPDPLVAYANTLLETSEPKVVVERINGPDAPPNLRLLVTVGVRYRWTIGPSTTHDGVLGDTC